MWRRDLPASSWHRAALPFPARSFRGKVLGMAREEIGDGPRPGARSRLPRRLPIDFPDDNTMRISHEAIYQAVFVQGRERYAAN